MADGNSYPFNSDIIDSDNLVQYQKKLSQQQQNLESYDQHEDLIDLLTWNNPSSHYSKSTDGFSSITSHSISKDEFNRLKYLIRSVIWPFDHRLRKQLWMNISTLIVNCSTKQHRNVRHPSQTGMTTSSMFIDNSLTCLSSKYNQWPKFVDINNLCLYHLIEPKGRSLLQCILLTFASQHPDVTYCPIVEPISALMLHYHNEHEILYSLNRLLIKNWLCGETRLQWEVNCHVFKKLSKLHYKSAANIIDLHYTNTKVFYQEWFWWIFRYLPFSYLIKIMDCFLLEGPKVLFRISLILVHLFTKRIKHGSNGNIPTITDFCQQIPISIDQLLRKAFRIRNFKRRKIEHLIEHEEKLLRNNRRQLPIEDLNQNINNNNSDIITARKSSLITPQYLTQIPQNSILNHDQFLTLWNWLPARLSLSQPIVVFTTEEHGFRLQTLLNKIDELEYSILIIKATNGEIFGAFCAGLWSNRHNRTYFGFGESFLFTLIPKQIKYSWIGQQQHNTNRQSKIKSEMFLFVNNEKLIIGGGNGEGLCIDQSLCEGRTAHCETFNNEPLCSETYFSISVLEMITFDFSSS